MSTQSRPQLPDLYEAGIVEIQAGLDTRLFSSVDLVTVRILFLYSGESPRDRDRMYPPLQAYLARIDEVNLKAAELRAVLEVNPRALEVAAQLDEERLSTGKRSLLHGIPVLVKVRFS